VVMRRDGDDVVIVHRPRGEVRVAVNDDAGVEFDEFRIPRDGFRSADFWDVRG